MKLQIKRVRLVMPAPIGKEAVVPSHLGFDSSLDGGSITLSFDKDPRFIRLDFNGKDYFELIPLTNCATILCELPS